MGLLRVFDRVYLRLDGNAYDDHAHALMSFNLMELIKEMAKANPNGDLEPLYDPATKKVFEGRAKAFLVRKVQKFIQGIPESQSQQENMADYASGRQLRYLIRAFKEEKKQISCYGLVYIYVIFTLLEEDSPYRAKCRSCMTALYNLIHDYFESNTDDELACFFVGCFVLIRQAMTTGDDVLSGQFPYRPRRNPKEPPGNG